jgi:hypothetical protein
MAMRHARIEPLSSRPPAAQRRHVGLDPGLVEEDQATRINLCLVSFPPGALSGDVRA